MSLSDKDRDKIIKRYTGRFLEYGYSPKTLGWDKGKQDIRFNILTSQYDFNNKSVLDIGCGFGDLNKTLKYKAGNNYKYLGLDIVPVLIKKAKKLYQNSKIDFQCCDFLSTELTNQYDYIIASGIFNFKIEAENNYSFIENIISKSFHLCRDGLAFDFLSDKVDYKHDHTFHSSPEQILGIAYKYSRNVIIRNDYMPFEFSLFIFKNESFDTSDTVFYRYKTL